MNENSQAKDNEIDSGEVAGGAAGAIGGGLAGAAVGGPVGGLIGAVVGAAAGATVVEALEGDRGRPDSDVDAEAGSTGEPAALASNEGMGSSAQPIGPVTEAATEGERIEEEVTGEAPGYVDRSDEALAKGDVDLADDPIGDPYAPGDTGYADIQDRRI